MHFKSRIHFAQYIVLKTYTDNNLLSYEDLMLLMNGVRYRLWVPEEESQFEEIVKEHSKEIFGGDTLYLDIKTKIAAKSGVGAIPDGYPIGFADNSWLVVEVELSKHPLHRHVISQLSTFMTAIKDSRKEIIDALYSRA